MPGHRKEKAKREVGEDRGPSGRKRKTHKNHRGNNVRTGLPTSGRKSNLRNGGVQGQIEIKAYREGVPRVWW